MTEAYENIVLRADGAIVPPRSKSIIEKIALQVRQNLQCENKRFLPIVKLYDFLEAVVEGAYYEVKFEHEMIHDQGLTYPHLKSIHIREDVMRSADRDDPTARFTLCHELGHLVMHRNIALARVDPKNPPDIFRNSEWQADVFASCLLMPHHLLSEHTSIEEITSAFGVSFKAAKVAKSRYK